MKLTVLVDNNTYIDEYYFGEPAVSYYIEAEDNASCLTQDIPIFFLRMRKRWGSTLAS